MLREASTLVWLALVACQPATEAQGTEPLPRDGATYWPAAEWRRAAPVQVGLDAGKLSRLVERLRSNDIPGIHSLVVVRHGYVAVEEYFNGSSVDVVHTMQSVSKSVTSLVTGIAIDDGTLATSSRVFDILPAYDTLIRGDERKRGITVEHLLQMRSGINYHESPYPGSPHERLNTSAGDWVAYALGEPMNAAPGERWQYNSGGVIALARTVEVATGVPFYLYARERLFNPLGITTQYWIVSRYDSLPHTGGGLNLRAADLARVGYLVLRHGIWNGRRIVSESWLQQSTRVHTSGTWALGGYDSSYGYLWWLMPVGNENMIVASGNMNQWLFILPSRDLVVAVTGANNNASVPAFVYRDILPAVIRD